MTLAQDKTRVNVSLPMTLEDYLTYDDGTETRYELVNGLLVEMATETPLNNTIAIFLVIYFASQLNIPSNQLATRHQIQVPSKKASAREPDLMVHSEASAEAILSDGKLLRLGYPEPRLVVEVVSSSDTDKASRDRDYVEKRSEYAERGIPEYWIIDPIAAVVIVLTLTAGEYTENTFAENAQLVSAEFGTLALTAKQILTASL